MNKNNSNSSVSSGGVSFTGLLLIVFITLKLTHVIDWSWWWVLSPLWIGLAVFMIFMVIAVIAMILIKKR